MILAFTRSKLPLSVLIRWFLDSDCSHFVLVFKSPSGGLMFESNLLGTHPKFYKTALKHMEVVHQIEMNLTPDQEDEVWDIVVDQFDGHAYNYRAFIYFCWRAFLKKIFHQPLPKTNPWSLPGTYLCDQVCYALQGLSPEPISLDLSMVTPEELYYYLKDWVHRASL
jgi:hypothetical protein